MATLPIFPAAAPEGDVRALPEYLPARMVNEFSYCPRLFFYEWVEGVFQESADTVEGAAQHRRVDEKPTALPGPGEVAAAIHARSVTLSSERLHAIAKMDLVEAEGGRATPVDYKHGSPREGPDGLEVWPSDKAQLAVQGIVLRDNGYQCDEGIVYYRKTGQRVRVALDEALVAETETLIRQAWAVAERGEIPPPLVDSPKCPGCSLVGICLPDETVSLTRARRGVDRILRYAFEMAKSRPKKHLTSATKSNGISVTMPYWDERFQAMAAQYPEVLTDQYHIDILCAQFVMHPDWFDVVVGSNLFGDILRSEEHTSELQSLRHLVC